MNIDIFKKRLSEKFKSIRFEIVCEEEIKKLFTENKKVKVAYNMFINDKKLRIVLHDALFEGLDKYQNIDAEKELFKLYTEEINYELEESKSINK